MGGIYFPVAEYEPRKTFSSSRSKRFIIRDIKYFDTILDVRKTNGAWYSAKKLHLKIMIIIIIIITRRKKYV